MKTSGPKSMGTPPYIILSFDGGGVRGLFQAIVTDIVQKEMRIVNEACMFAGTSTGAIIAAGLGIGKEPAELRGLYENLLSRIFARRMAKKAKSLVKNCAMYDAGLLEEACKEVFPRNPSLGDCEVRTLVVASRYDDLAPEVFDSYDSSQKDIPLIKVVLASCAAPFFFVSRKIDIKGVKTTYLDGGLVCNNPSFLAAQTANSEGINFKDIRLLAIGNGRYKKLITGTIWDKMRFPLDLLEIAMTGNSKLAEKFCDQRLAKDDYIRTNPILSQKIGLANHKKASRYLPRYALEEANSILPRVKAWFGDT